MWIYRCWKNSFIQLGFTYHNIHQFPVDNPIIFSRVVYPSQYIYFFKQKNLLFIYFWLHWVFALLLVAFSICPECCHSFSGCRAWDSVVAPQNNIYISCRNTFPSFSFQFSSVQFSRSVVFDSLRPHESQHARPPCPSPTPGVHPNSRASSQWCHPVISSSVVPFSSCPQSLPASGSCPVSQLFAWSIGVSALASALSKKSQGWSPSEWTGWISLPSKGPSRVFPNTTVQKHQFFGAQLSSQSNSHIHTWPLEKP